MTLDPLCSDTPPLLPRGEGAWLLGLLPGERTRVYRRWSEGENLLCGRRSGYKSVVWTICSLAL